MTATRRKKKRVRSPAYPAIDLATAIQHAGRVYQHEKRSSAPVAVVAADCGLDIKNSSGMRLIAALKQFGLGIEEGSKEDRHLRLSDAALDILLAESDNAQERVAAIKKAAMGPKVHRVIWDHFKGELPSDASLRSFLVRKLEFNDAHVDGFIRLFRSTIAFANLPDSDIMEGENGESPPAPERDEHTRQIAQPKPVAMTIPPPASGTSKQDVFTLDEGPVVVQWPARLSPESIEDVSQWWPIMLRKIKRSVIGTSPNED